MKKIFLFFALFAALIFVISCGGGSSKSDKTNDSTDTGETVTDDDAADTDEPAGDTDDGGDSASDNGDSQPDDDADTETKPKEEGIYLGIIGFNYQLHPKPIEILTDSNMTEFQDFIGDLKMDDGTALYFADYTALSMMRDYTPVPQKLSRVALVTFTDGEDTSSDGPTNDPENYNDPEVYLNAIHSKIKNEGIHGHSVEAYSIGLRSGDTGSDFKSRLEKLASYDDYAFEVSDMEEVKERFRIIAESLYSTFKTIDIDFKVLGNYSDGTRMRFSLDIFCDHDENVCEKNGINSNLYIDATYRRSGNERSFDNFAYHGFSGSLTTVKCGERDEKGFYPCKFENLQYDDMNTEIKQIELWKNDNNEWKHENEALKQEDSKVNESKSSALIMLVLDCTTSLGNSKFKKLQEAGKDFIETLVNGGSGTTEDDPTTPEDPCDPNPCSSISNSTGVCTVSGSSYVCGCNSGYDWSGLACVSGSSPSLPECSSSSGTPCKDSSSGLIWSAMASSTYTWQNAVNYCSSYSEGGLSGWHLPTISELRTLIKNCSGTQMPGGSCGVIDTGNSSTSCLSSSCWTESACYSCSYDSTGGHSKFGETGGFWSSSTYVNNTNGAWLVDFGYGSVGSHNKASSYSGVRCVR